MKKFIFGFILFIFGFSFVSASEYSISSFGTDNCLTTNQEISYQCTLDASTGEVKYYNSSISRVTPYIFSISEFTFVNSSSAYRHACFYDSSYEFISCTGINSNRTSVITAPVDSYFMRLSYVTNSDIIIVEESNISSLAVLNNSLTNILQYIIELLSSLNIVIYIVLGIIIVFFLVWCIKSLRGQFMEVSLSDIYSLLLIIVDLLKVGFGVVFAIFITRNRRFLK